MSSAANFHLYVFPFINLLSRQKTIDLLKVTSLGVIGALLKGDDSSEAVKHLVKTELIVLCLRIMKKGTDVSRTTATFIVMKILLDNVGLEYICRTEDRMSAVAQILKDLMEEIDSNKATDAKEQKMASQILRCFLRLSENSKWADQVERDARQVHPQRHPQQQPADPRGQADAEVAETADGKPGKNGLSGLTGLIIWAT